MFIFIIVVLMLLFCLTLITIPTYNYKKNCKEYTGYTEHKGYISDCGFSSRPSSEYGSNGYYSQDFLSMDNIKDFLF